MIYFICFFVIHSFLFENIVYFTCVFVFFIVPLHSFLNSYKYENNP